MNQDASQVLLSSAPKIQLTMVGGLVARHLCDTVGLLLGLVDTLKVIIRFCLKVGKTTLKKSCTRTKAWKGGCGHKEGLFNNYLQDHSFGLGNLGHILLSTSQRLKGN